jgi:hypothetical protein|tara:strand:+ start:30 stop:356 length:327 start_codon:yes stop_codon:yes gene_type:complete
MKKIIFKVLEFLVVTVIITSCSVQRGHNAELWHPVKAESSDFLITQNMINVMKLIDAADNMERIIKEDIEAGRLQPEDQYVYLSNIQFMRDLLWDIAYADYIIHESTP